MRNIFDDLTSSTEGEPADSTDEGVLASDTSPPSLASFTSRDVRAAVQELLRYGSLEADRKPNLYHSARIHSDRIAEILEPLDLCMQIDDVRGLAFLTVSDTRFVSEDDGEQDDADEWHHPLVRRQRLTLEQSLVVAILRQMYLAHEQEAGIGSDGATVSLDDIASSLLVYFGNSGSDSHDEKRVRTLLEALRSHGIVSAIDEKGEVNIRPIITHVASPESLQALLEFFRQQANDQGGA